MKKMENQIMLFFVSLCEFLPYLRRIHLEACHVLMCLVCELRGEKMSCDDSLVLDYDD